MMKSCEKCGRTIQTDDYYSYISRKYCPLCAADMKRQKKAEWAKEMRRKKREEHALTRELCTSQQKEIDFLRQLVQAQKVRLRALGEDGT